MKRRRNKFNFRFLKKWSRNFFLWGRRSLPFGILSFVILFLFFGVKRMLHADPYFQVEKITVFPAGVLNGAELHFLERKTKGKSLVEVDLKELSQVLERNPQIERAEVVRVLPKQLNIYLIRRMPVLEVQLKPNGPYFLISHDQMITAITEQPKPELLILEDYESPKKNYSIGMLYQKNNFSLLKETIISIQNELASRDETVAKLTVDQAGNVSVFLKDGLELKVGKQFSLAPATRLVLGSLLKSKERAEYLYLDLRYRDIILKKKSD